MITLTLAGAAAGILLGYLAIGTWALLAAAARAGARAWRKLYAWSHDRPVLRSFLDGFTAPLLTLTHHLNHRPTND